MNNKFRDLIRLTNNIYRCTQVYLDKRLEKLNLTTGTYPYLLVLNKNEGISQNEISRELNVDKAMSARTVKKLIEFGYIRKEENENDIRAYKLFLTDKGKAIIPEIITIIEGWTNHIIQGNEEEQIENALEFLGKILENAKEMKKNCCERVKNIER
ncbi:MarR family winged helix-turn-helix transcriptional regulator [Clostridium sp. SHJSY1]|uniref:MarR family winged helix-turn-helix transcriptional regulator n=1 Tax=Clostridium sp. SHJSY1 TaxID=2942483 RepID=UPI002874A6EC|nr:MarR family winged helix-turn-helix transcriptional regulator [Clostridium sp. SHJSY1]MDS0524556.1 MarR family winged helix-turn-helix transcriptional regulator [Clostridium sp. SHJSY1]